MGAKASTEVLVLPTRETTTISKQNTESLTSPVGKTRALLKLTEVGKPYEPNEEESKAIEGTDLGFVQKEQDFLVYDCCCLIA